ncbi:1,4-dihydroxy-2-naphthoate octaprenyltransferase [compost metagenome]
MGRKTLPMVLGRRGALWILGGQWLLAYGCLLVAAWRGGQGAGAAVGLCSLPLALRAWRLLRRDPASPSRLLPALGLNAAISVATPALMAVGLLITR